MSYERRHDGRREGDGQSAVLVSSGRSTAPFSSRDVFARRKRAA